MNRDFPVIRDEKGSALAVIDQLQRYMQELHAYPMLTADEEYELAKRYREHGDVEAAKKLVTTHLRLVAKIAMEYRSAYQNTLDLIQEGTIGLLQAVRHFDPDKGARLGHYATWWIKSYILKYIIDNFRLIKLGTTKDQKKLFYNLMREKERLQAAGFEATPLEIATQLGVDADAVVDMERRLTQPEYALEAPIKAGGDGISDATLQDFLPNSDIPVDELMAREQTSDVLKERLDQFSKTLKPKEQRIFTERLLSELPLTLQEIADEYGISKERVRQLEERLLEKLKKFIKESGLDENSLQI